MNGLNVSDPVHVVLIDDDVDQLALCGRALTNHSDRAVIVSAYEDPDTALEALRVAQTPDLIVVDVHMRPISGPIMVAKLRSCAHLASVSVLMLSSLALAPDLLAAREAGASGYLLKPRGTVGWPKVAAALLDGWGDVDLFSHAEQH